MTRTYSHKEAVPEDHELVDERYAEQHQVSVAEARRRRLAGETDPKVKEPKPLTIEERIEKLEEFVVAFEAANLKSLTPSAWAPTTHDHAYWKKVSEAQDKKAAEKKLVLDAENAKGADVVVSIVSTGFVPDDVEVKAGQTVSWKNDDTVPHSASQDDHAFDTGSIAPGATSLPIPIGNTVTLRYHCMFHSDLAATLNGQKVGSGGGYKQRP